MDKSAVQEFLDGNMRDGFFRVNLTNGGKFLSLRAGARVKEADDRVSLILMVPKTDSETRTEEVDIETIDSISDLMTLNSLAWMFQVGTLFTIKEINEMMGRQREGCYHHDD